MFIFLLIKSKQHILSRHNAHAWAIKFKHSATSRSCDKLELIESGTDDVGLSTSIRVGFNYQDQLQLQGLIFIQLQLRSIFDMFNYNYMTHNIQLK